MKNSELDDAFFKLLASRGHDKQIRKGRNVRDGYARGWGLQFGDLRKIIFRDPLYQEGARLITGRSIVAEDKRMNIFLILKYFFCSIPYGDIVEFGAYRGGNALFMAYIASKLYPGVRVYALDTFTGMPETDLHIDAHNEGDFRDVDLNELRGFSEAHKLNNVEFIQGLFKRTASTLLQKIQHVALAHIDCDIYSAVSFSYEVVKPYMVPGGYFVFDDADVSSSLGATEAVEELVIRRDGLNSEQIFPHFVFRSGLVSFVVQIQRLLEEGKLGEAKNSLAERILLARSLGQKKETEKLKKMLIRLAGAKKRLKSNNL